MKANYNSNQSSNLFVPSSHFPPGGAIDMCQSWWITLLLTYFTHLCTSSDVYMMCTCGSDLPIKNSSSSLPLCDLFFFFLIINNGISFYFLQYFCASRFVWNSFIREMNLAYSLFNVHQFFFILFCWKPMLVNTLLL